MKIIIGFDEVGRGPLAGPVVVACVFCKAEFIRPEGVVIRDSKKMTQKQKKEANHWICENFPFGIGQVPALEIDKQGIANAVRLSAFLAFKNLKSKIDFSIENAELLVDGNDEWLEGSRAIIKGDDKIIQISMASIIAKVYRDDLMKKLALKYPQYGFENHVGYGTAKHIEAIRKYGLIEGVHRKSFCGRILLD